MMILTAVILLVGFLVLAGMVARVAQTTSQTNAAADRPILRAIRPLSDNIDATITRMAAPTSSGGVGLTGWPQIDPVTHLTKPAIEDAVAQMMAHVQVVESNQGLFMDYKLECTAPNTGRVVVSLSDGETWVQLKSLAFARPVACLHIVTDYVFCDPLAAAGTFAKLADCDNSRAEAETPTELHTSIAETITSTYTSALILRNGTATTSSGATTPDNALMTDAAYASLGAATNYVEATGFNAPTGAASISQLVVGFQGKYVQTGTPVTWVQTVTGTGNAANTVVSASMTAAAGNFYIAAIANGDTTLRTVSSVAGMGLTWTLVDVAPSAGNVGKLEVWKGAGTATTGQVTATFAGGNTERSAIMVSRYSGVDLTAPIQDHQPKEAASAGTAWTTTSVTGSANGAYYVAVNGVTSNAATFTAPLNEHVADVGATQGVRLGVADAAAVAGSNTGAGTVATSVRWQTIALTLKSNMIPVPSATLSYTLSGTAGTSITTGAGGYAALGTSDALFEIPISGSGFATRPPSGSWSVADLANVKVRVTSASGPIQVNHAYLKIVYVRNYYGLGASGIQANFGAGALADGASVPPHRFLDVRAGSSPGGETFNVQVWCVPGATTCTPSTWTTRETITVAALVAKNDYSMVDGEWNAGHPLIRFIDADPLSGGPNTLAIDYIRIDVS